MNISNQKTFDEQQVLVCADNVTLEGDLVIPQSAAGIVLFAHGSGSSRHSSRNRFVAQRLQKAGLATLLFDLLTLQEEEVDVLTRQHRFDIDLLTRRLAGATNWLGQQSPANRLAIGYFGASTGAAAALRAAAELPDKVSAVVSRGGRPDLAMTELPRVQAPTLLIVGGFDTQVIELN
jgi:putative phosphoribosyl transferase